MKKTVICHFFNEEYLLPWWLSHHKPFFDHGILINYNSTDSSLDVINKICPEWTVIPSCNKYFDSASIDREVYNIEKNMVGWRICLNITEFLVGNYNLLNDIGKQQMMIGNYVFVDNTSKTLDHNIPLYHQIYSGYGGNAKNPSQLGLGYRTLRSVHNKRIKYPLVGGRHFYGAESTDDLKIFYYGYLLNIHEMINRKIQIKNKMSPREINRLKRYPSHPNLVSAESFVSKILKHQLPRCINMKSQIDRLLTLQNMCT